MSEQKVIVSVHERLDEPGYVVRLVAHQDGQERVAKFPCSTFEEAEGLAISIKGMAETEGGVDALLPDPSDDR